jgi:uncharacterized membrane protein SirB2
MNLPLQIILGFMLLNFYQSAQRENMTFYFTLKLIYLDIIDLQEYAKKKSL